MGNKTIKVLVTGAAGQISYNLLFRIANGEMFGRNQKLILHLLDLPMALNELEGVKMELMDCAFPLLKEVVITDDIETAYRDVNWALLIGSKPRGKGMERNDLITENAPIFKTAGQALENYAASNVRVVVVGNPCNTNCLIAMYNAPSIPKNRFHAMTFLDQNRAQAQLALKAQVQIGDVSNIVIWGNHSSTQVPDFFNAKICGEKATDYINDNAYLENEFIQIVAQRGASIIKSRGKSSAASAASALVNHVQALQNNDGKVFSSCVSSDKNPYGIPEGLIFSFPCCSDGKGNYTINPNFEVNEFLREKLEITTKELLKEKDLIKNLL